VGEVLDGAITTIRRHPKITIGLAAIVVTVQQLIAVIAQVSTGSVSQGFFPGSELERNLSAFTPLRTGVGLALAGLNLVIGTILGALLTGMLIIVVGESVLGRPVMLGDVWDRVRPRFWALLGGSLLAGLLPYAGFVIAILVGIAVGLLTTAVAGAVVGFVIALVLLVPGAYLWGVLALTTPAITLERLGPIQGLRRSWRLVRPDFWRVWGIRALATVIAQFLAGIITVPFSLVGVLILLSSGLTTEPSGPRLLAFLILVAIGGIIAGAIVQPFLASVLGLLYVDRRMRGEGLDITLQETVRAAEPARSGPDPGPTAPGWA
jgi:hypothetical protein